MNILKKIFTTKKQKLIEQVEKRDIEYLREVFENIPLGTRIDLGTIYNSKYYEYDKDGNIVKKEAT